MKRIVIDGRTLLDYPYTGVGEYTSRIVDVWGRHGRFPNAVLWYNAARPARIPEFPNLQYVKTVRANSILSANFSVFGFPHIDRLVGGADLIWMPNGNFAAWSGSAKTLLTVHDLSFERFPEFFSHKQRMWHAAIRPRRLCQRANHLIAASEHTKRDLVELYGISPEHITVVYSGVNQHCTPLVSDAERARVRAHYHLPARFILSLATLEPRKNIISIIEAFSRIRASGNHSDIQLVIAGRRGYQAEQVLRSVRSSPVSDAISYIGYVSDTDKPALYASASLFVYPSYYEGFGLPPLEAQASGIPVIAGAHSALAEVMGDSALLIHPDCVDEIARAMELFLTDTSVYELYRSRGLKNSSRFSWEDAANNTAKVIENLLS